MSRIVILAISVLAAILPGIALALSLGQIDLKSGLNQPFRAEIPVTSASADELTGLDVRLASADTFERYGLNQAGFLTDFKFAVTGNVIRISSVDPVVEPFVTMLLEVTWGQGRLLREYTVLLDPPVFEAPVAAPAQPAPAEPASPAARPVQRPAPTPTPAPSLVQRPEPAATQPSLVQRPEPAATRPSPQPADPAAAPGTLGTLPVQRNDTLWSIARRTRPDTSITLNQMMLAIYDANPAAFDGNINRLRAGAILRIPEARAAAGMSRREAFAEVRRQNESWRAATPAGADTARLRLVPPADEAAAAQEPGSAAAAASATAAARVAELEEELAQQKRLVELKDRQLAALQDQLESLREEQQAAALPPPTEAPVDEVPAEEAVVDEAPPAEAPVDEVPGEAPAVPEPEVEAEAEPTFVPPPAISRPAEEPSFIGQLLTSPWLYGGVVLALLAGLFIARRRRGEDTAEALVAGGPEGAFDEDTRFATDVLDVPSQVAQDIVVEESPPPKSEPLEVAGSAPAEVAAEPAGDQELPLEKTLSSPAGLDLDESDPVAEAEFHSAYGLYDQAADLLNAALEQQPGRLDLRRKLIEVYFSWDNRGGFLKAAQDYHDRKDPDDNFWNKVLVMGKQLCPEEVLFAEAPTVAGDEIDMDLALTAEDAGDVDLQLGDEDADVDLDLSGIRPMPEDAGGLDFDLAGALAEDNFGPTERIGPEGVASTLETPTIEAPGPDSSLSESPTIAQPGPESTAETPTIEAPGAELPEDAGRTSETAALDLDELGLDLGEFDDVGSDEGQEPAFLEDAETGEYATPAIDDTSDEAIDEEEVPAGVGDTVEQPRPGTEDTAEQPVLDEADVVGMAASDESLDFDLGEPVADIGEQVADAEEPGVTMDSPPAGRDGPTMTEVGTKLDLARAYIDMGDPDGARSILGEVIEEGDEPQRQEAQRLLDTLAV